MTLARIFAEAGLPEGLLQVLPGGRDVGEAVVDAPEVSVISFTGSTAAGRKVGEAAGRLLKRRHLELGGNNALIVLPGADLAAATSAGAFGSWMHQGQICMTTGRHLVHDSLYDDYVGALSERARNLPVGNPAAEEVALGPIIDEGRRRRVRDIIDKAQADGARLAAGGAGEGAFVPPTVLADLTPTNPAWTQEIFGPVAPVGRFSTLEEAAELVNASEYGLSLGILGDVGMALELADLVDTGKVHINEQTVSDEANVPFGGMKDSGNGSRFGGAQANIEAFTETQWVTMRPEIARTRSDPCPASPLPPPGPTTRPETPMSAPAAPSLRPAGETRWPAVLCWLAVALEGFDLVVLGAVIPQPLATGALGFTPEGRPSRRR